MYLVCSPLLSRHVTILTHTDARDHTYARAHFFFRGGRAHTPWGSATWKMDEEVKDSDGVEIGPKVVISLVHYYCVHYYFVHYYFVHYYFVHYYFVHWM